jgi:hypothetical protein
MIFLALLGMAQAFEMGELSLEYKQIGAGSVIYELPPGSRGVSELNLNLTFSPFGNVYMNNQVHSIIDQSKFALVGWKFELGVFLTRWLSVYMEHFSRHALDSVWTVHGHFPLYDAVGVRVKIL